MNTSYTAQWRRTAGWLLCFLAGLALGGCQAAHMALPEDLPSDTAKLPVEGRAFSVFDGTFEFGPYRVTDVHRGWTDVDNNSVSSGGSEISSAKAKQKYRFSINGPDRPARAVHCTNTANWSGMETDGLMGGRFGIEASSNHRLDCTLTPDGGGTPSQLVMTRSLSANETALRGVMTDGGEQIGIAGTHRLDTTSLKMGRTSGYIFRIGDRPVGAVEVINSGTVWLDDSLAPETRSALAAASAVLLLYQDIQKAHEGIEGM